MWWTRKNSQKDDPPAPERGDLALVLSGGGARAAYQVGLLRCLARRHPDLSVQILTGVSAGAINVSMLAAHEGTFAEAVERLYDLWANLEAEDVFRADKGSLLRQMASWSARLVSGGSGVGRRAQGLVDTAPLRELLTRALHPNEAGVLPGIDAKLRQGSLGAEGLKAVAVTTLNYATGQTVTWVQGRDIRNWERNNRRSRQTRLRVDHVMASSALPLAFPAVKIDRDWHGDGGVRLSAPLSPALHLGARRILAVSTRYQRTAEEQERPETTGYPPPAQVAGQLMKAIFLDVLDDDVTRMERFNNLVRRIPEEERDGMRLIDIVALRPSVDLGTLASEYEPRLPGFFRYLTRSLGTKDTKSPDFLSLLMFQRDYLKRVIEIGEADAEARVEEIEELLIPEKAAAPQPV